MNKRRKIDISRISNEMRIFIFFLMVSKAEYLHSQRGNEELMILRGEIRN